MSVWKSAASVILTLFASSGWAQTETEEEELVFMEIVGTNVQVPSSFASAVCGLVVAEVTTQFGGTTDPVCSLDEQTASQMGLMDDEGQPVDLSRQSFINVQLPDNETRIQLPLSIAADLCETEESELADDSMNVRLVGCEVSQEQLEVSNLPGLQLVQSGDTQGAASGGSGD